LTNFTQVLPVEGAPPTERTDVRFVYTRDQLYIGIRCFDQLPARILATQMRRDHGLETDDVVTIAFDTFNRQHDGYFFAVNPNGSRSDGLIQNFSETKYEWDALWQARARIDDLGWTIELAIPFKSLSFDPLHDTWGCNVERVIRRKQEIVRWNTGPIRQRHRRLRREQPRSLDVETGKRHILRGEPGMGFRRLAVSAIADRGHDESRRDVSFLISRADIPVCRFGRHLVSRSERLVSGNQLEAGLGSHSSRPSEHRTESPVNRQTGMSALPVLMYS
jgi:hypothetical protein